MSGMVGIMVPNRSSIVHVVSPRGMTFVESFSVFPPFRPVVPMVDVPRRVWAFAVCTASIAQSAMLAKMIIFRIDFIPVFILVM